ncbi:zinc transporter ZntB [Marinihelvus fidelis]|uniref:Zinc transporter ZntB n=1 Tax=Marinihelvus fidelis TaxID=2613842 RepID=A0A5N0T6P2_9GAMM|nr:zinc transporter ZntB [Marinihelvus fidelis]KAA9129807.1 zinc transporter ZntB [Marinihelvus fidelis]
MENGLIHAFVLKPGGDVESLDFDGVRAWTPEQGVLWAHFQLDATDAREWLGKRARLPHLVPEALLAGETRPRASSTGEGILVTLRGVNLNPGADPEDMVSIRMWVDEHRLISTRRRQLLSVQDAVKSMTDVPVTGTPDLVLRITNRLTERMGDVIDDLEDRVALLEASIMEKPDPTIRADLSELRREAIALRRYLAPQREALTRMQLEPPAFFSDLDRVRLREITDRLVRLVEDLDAVRERASVVQEELVSRLSDQMNQRMYVLSVVAALFLPMGFLTGLLGINVGGIPMADNPFGFWIFTGLLVLVLAIQLFVFLRKRWF